MDKDFAERLKETLLPRFLTCDFCLRESFSQNAVCERCAEKLPFNNGYICPKCGRKTKFMVACCDECSGKKIDFDLARSAFTYLPPISSAIVRLKYDGGKYLAETFAEYLAKVYDKTLCECDGIAFVPISEKRREKRGYNQAELIGRALSKKICLPIFEDVLYKKRDTDSQVGLTQKQRIINLSGSFAVRNRSKIDGKRILLVDDVMTTGATVNAISEKLKAAGAEFVFALTVTSVDRGTN